MKKVSNQYKKSAQKNMYTFNEKCYAALRKVPKGKVTTYKLLAKALKSRAFRAVGNAMKRNPYMPKVPCHRVVKSDGSLGGYAGGTAKKRALLKSEGISFRGDKIENLSQHLYKF